jgi:hypothetical protein
MRFGNWKIASFNRIHLRQRLRWTLRRDKTARQVRLRFTSVFVKLRRDRGIQVLFAVLENIFA